MTNPTSTAANHITNYYKSGAVGLDVLWKAKQHAQSIDLGEAISGVACYDKNGDPIDEPDQFTVAAIEIDIERAK